MIHKIIDDELRGTGRSTAQIKVAPTGAVFVCSSDFTDETCRLVNLNNRGDLYVVSQRRLSTVGSAAALLKRANEHIVVEHDAKLSAAQQRNLDYLRAAYRCREVS
jgi:hypothetical protein